MAFVKKFAIGSIFISILSIFAMSHNANAVQLSYNLNDYELLYSAAQPKFNVLFNNVAYNNNQTRLLLPYSSSEQFINNIRTSDSFTYKAGDIFEFYISIGTLQNYQLGGGTLSIHEGTGTYPTEFLSVLSIEQVSLAETPFLSISSAVNSYDELNSVWGFASAKVHYIYKVALIAMGDYTSSIGLSNPLNDYIFRFYQQINNNSDPTVAITFNYLKHYRRGESQENKEVEEKTQEAVDESVDAGSDSSSSASSGGANLLTAITGFFNVITSAQPTNCRFNAPLNTYFGNERLNVDLCSLDLPSGIGALTSIIAIGILIPFAIHMFNKFIALFRSFQS